MTMTTDHEANAEEYNGWPNRETWAASLHLSNDFGIYEMVNGWANDARHEAMEDAERDEFGFYADGVTTIEARTTTILADMLSNYIGELRIDMHNGEADNMTERMMVLEIGSEWRVDWRRLAENWLEGFEFEGGDR